MNKPILIWQTNVFPDAEKEFAARYFEIKEVDFLDTRTVCELIEQDTPYSFRGAVSLASRLGFKQEKFCTRQFIPYLEDFLLSRDFQWMTAKQTLKHFEWEQSLRASWEDKYQLFVRPDSSKKLFAGQVFTAEKFEEEYNWLCQKNSEKILCFVADVERITYEYRCLFIGSELVGVSTYMLGGEILDEPSADNIPQGVIDLAKTIRTNEFFSPEENLTIDIAQRLGNTFGLVEINQLETSGFYAANLDEVYKNLAAQLNYAE